MRFAEGLEKLALEHDITGTTVPYSFAVEYLDERGYIDYAHFTRKHKIYGSVKDFRSAVREVFDTVQFTYEEPTEFVSKEDFLADYKFAKFPRVIQWVGFFAKTYGTLLRKEDLFEWVLETSAPARPNYSVREINNIG